MKEKDAPLNTKVNQDKTYYLSNELNGHELPTWAVPNTLHNDGNYIISLGNLCRWMASQAENLGVEIYPGFSANRAIIDEQNRVCGVITGDMGLDKTASKKPISSRVSNFALSLRCLPKVPEVILVSN